MSPCRASKRVKCISIETKTLQVWLTQHAKDLDHTPTTINLMLNSSTSQQNANVARFLIVKSEEKDKKVSDLSPFAIKRAFKQLRAILRVSKRLKSGDLLLEVEKKSHITNLLSTNKNF